MSSTSLSIQLMLFYCCLIGMSIIPIIIWLIALALGLFKSPFRICVRHTNGRPHALSSALLLFHARPWKHLPQLWHSSSSKGPTPSLSVGWVLLGTHSMSLSSLCPVHTHRPFFIYSAQDTLNGPSCFLLIVRRLFTGRSPDCYLCSAVCFTSWSLDYSLVHCR